MRGAAVTWKTVLAWLFGGGGTLVLIGVMIWLLIGELERRKPTEAWVEATPAPEVRRAPKKKVTVKAPVTVYQDGGTRLKLPKEAQTPDTEVIAATQVRGSERPQTVTTTINTQTGESQTFVRQDPYPWFAVEPRGEARLSIGYKLRDSMPQQVIRLGINQDLFRVKAFTAGISGTVDSDGDAFLGIGVAYRW